MSDYEMDLLRWSYEAKVSLCTESGTSDVKLPSCDYRERDAA